MKVIYGVGNLKASLKKTIVAIGVFDGVHLGHQALIKAAVNRARKLKAKSLVITFDPHPVHILHPEIKLPCLVSLDYRLKLIEDLGVDACLVLRFNKTFAKQSPEKFVKKYLVDLVNAREVFVGDDFRFGQGRSGTLDGFASLANDCGFKLNVVKAVKGKSSKISSTQLRSYVLEGELKQAKKLLGRSFALYGKVVRGDARGRMLGYPTANVDFKSDVFPPYGVYIVEVVIKKKRYQGVANIGCRPSFKKANQVNLEVHIFDFKRSIYGQYVTVEFIKQIREEMTFLSKEALISQIKRDEAVALKHFKR